jgi:ABC-type branched-subunit amino acid transport system permease subunit
MRRILRDIALGVAGGIVGFMSAFPMADRPSDLLLIVTTLLGVVLTLAVHRYARF